MNDTTTSLYEHIKNRMASGFGFGDDGQVIVDRVPDHRISYQSIREDCEGDVGVFEYIIDSQGSYDRLSIHTLWRVNVQFSVVTKNGDIEAAKKYLIKSFENLADDVESSNVYVKGIRLINLHPFGKNSKGLQMVVMNTQIFCYINDED